MDWRNYRDLDSMREQLNRLFTPSWLWQSSGKPDGYPVVNIYETPEEYIVVSEVPGAKKDKFDLSMTAGNLVIRGEFAEHEEEGSLLRSERPRGAFNRVISLSDKVDPKRVDANYMNGILTVRVAKSQEAKPRQIEVKVS